jgi:hypothetical protein
MVSEKNVDFWFWGLKSRYKKCVLTACFWMITYAFPFTKVTLMGVLLQGIEVKTE